MQFSGLSLYPDGGERNRETQEKEERNQPVRHPRCDAYVRTHPGTNIPVGTLANRELRTLRNQAHHYFDQLYLSGLMSKQDAYLWLAGLLQVPLSKAHIGFLGEYYCNEVIAESKKLLERRRKQQPAGFRPCKGGEAS